MTVQSRKLALKLHFQHAKIDSNHSGVVILCSSLFRALESWGRESKTCAISRPQGSKPQERRNVKKASAKITMTRAGWGEKLTGSLPFTHAAAPSPSFFPICRSYIFGTWNKLRCILGFIRRWNGLIWYEPSGYGHYNSVIIELYLSTTEETELSNAALDTLVWVLHY